MFSCLKRERPLPSAQATIEREWLRMHPPPKFEVPTTLTMPRFTSSVEEMRAWRMDIREVIGCQPMRIELPAALRIPYTVQPDYGLRDVRWFSEENTIVFDEFDPDFWDRYLEQRRYDSLDCAQL